MPTRRVKGCVWPADRKCFSPGCGATYGKSLTHFSPGAGTGQEGDTPELFSAGRAIKLSKGMDFISRREKPSWELQGRASAGVVALQQQGHFHRASSCMPMPCACSGGPKIKQNRIKCLFLLLLCHGKKRQVSTNQCGTRSRVVPGLQQRQQKVSLVVTFEFPLASRPLSLNQAHSPHMQVCFVLFFFPCS